MTGQYLPLSSGNGDAIGLSIRDDLGYVQINYYSPDKTRYYALERALGQAHYMNYSCSDNVFSVFYHTDAEGIAALRRSLDFAVQAGFCPHADALALKQHMGDALRGKLDAFAEQREMRQ